MLFPRKSVSVNMVSGRIITISFGYITATVEGVVVVVLDVSVIVVASRKVSIDEIFCECSVLVITARRRRGGWQGGRRFSCRAGQNNARRGQLKDRIHISWHRDGSIRLTFISGVVVETPRVVTVPTVAAVVVVDVVEERPGSQMLNDQNDGSVIGADSGPVVRYDERFSMIFLCIVETHHKILFHWLHLQHKNNQNA